MIGLFCVIVTIINVSALEKSSNDIEFRMCTLSDEYIEWEKLSDEEKEKVLMPPMCDVDADQIVSNNVGISLFSDDDVLPATYDGRTTTFSSKIKNQSSTGSCWAFSTTSALEYYVGKNYQLSFEYSPRHIVYSSVRSFLNGETNEFGFNRLPSDGGNFFTSTNYFANGLGPVLESDMPFEDNEDTIDISEIQGKEVQLDINDTILKFDSTSGSACTDSEIEEIKKYIYQYGSVVMSTYMTTSSKYYNSITGGFYYNGTASTNHAVLFIGWDDNYSKDNFASTNKPSSDGAWIVQNSYGTSFGDAGYYYISYEDVHVCDFYMVIKGMDQSVENNVYSLDTLGFNTFYGLTSGGVSYTSAYAMNVFTKEAGKKEVLKEVTFGSVGEGEYTIYYTEGNGQDKAVSEMTLIGSGSLEYLGYVTHSLDEALLIGEDVTDFSIVVFFNMKSSTVPLPLSSSSSSLYQYITLDDEKSFVSLNGSNWLDLKDMSSYTLIASIKAFTDDFVIEEIKSDIYKVDNEKLIIYAQPGATSDEFLTNIEMILTTDAKVKYEMVEEKIYTGLMLEDYLIVVLGDVNGDGAVKMNDVMQISQYIVDKTGLDNDYFKLAADVNLDLSIKMNDVMKISSYIVEGGTL